MIRLEGTEEHPRFNNSDHIVENFNKYLTNSFYRYVIMLSIQGTYKFRDPNNRVENAISEASLMIDTTPDEGELASLREVLLIFVLSKRYMDDFRGPLFEQIIRFSGPENPINNYNPKCNSLEEGQIFCERTSYNNGDCDKNVDLVFFEEGLRINPNCFEVERFIACEVKCNINSFITGIVNALRKGKELMAISNYTKLLYLKEIVSHFLGLSTVLICTLNGISAFSKGFLKDHDLECLGIWEPTN
ncbi:hypothetical protein J1P26_15020 [Neobacillus sp. MM2021_6]|uniref:hypothetical protein n=1 Tax=Bacillaceae TaxID=186817 RepID=UPI00140AF7B9|nr:MULTISPECIES: hypothetical protein [Bacillaceae]MBO0961011.1 hypothetical protein [Neobacillus sp. MM2021_6]NHC19077.1 hypothetical protein [Bacillus sp. MM2020_4]